MSLVVPHYLTICYKYPPHLIHPTTRLTQAITNLAYSRLSLIPLRRSLWPSSQPRQTVVVHPHLALKIPWPPDTYCFQSYRHILPYKAPTLYCFLSLSIGTTLVLTWATYSPNPYSIAPLYTLTLLLLCIILSYFACSTYTNLPTCYTFFLHIIYATKEFT